MSMSRSNKKRPNRAESKDVFSRFAKQVAKLAGKGAAFMAAAALIVVWALTGPIFHFSDTWQLVINTGTTIITFLMVFLIQNTQNRDSDAIQVKLDELIRVTKGHNALLDLEDLSQEELDRIREPYRELARKARKELAQGGRDTNTPEVRGQEPGSQASKRLVKN